MNASNAEGIFDEAKGKVKEAVGETFNDQSLANQGAADQVKGQAKEAWGNVKDAAHNIGSTNAAEAEATGARAGSGFRDSVTRAAESVKDSVNRGIEDLEGKR